MIFGGTACFILLTFSWIPNDFRAFFPGFYISFLACLSIYSTNWIIKHPHDYPMMIEQAKIRAMQMLELRKSITKTNTNSDGSESEGEESGSESDNDSDYESDQDEVMSKATA